MPTFTSVKSGYWNDPTTWDQNAVPVDGDTVTVASGHTVIFNVDQSGFATGLAGLTINGTLKIPSQAEDSSMPNFVCLKVNANIAGSGAFLIGSSDYPIVYPQRVLVLINGSITNGVVQIYGERRYPFYDFPAATIPANATSFQLQSGLPLRAGDVIAIGRGNYKGDPFITFPPSDLYFTVQSYDPSTKTVTVSPAIVNSRPTNSIIGLVSRPVELRRYGSASNIATITGSGRILQGCLLDMQNLSYIAANVSSSSATNVVAINGRKGDSSIFPVGPNNTEILLVYGHQGWRHVSGINVTDAVLISINEGLGGDGSGVFQTVKVQNAVRGFFPYTWSSGYVINDAWFVGIDRAIAIGRADLLENCFVDYANALVVAGATLRNITVGPEVSRIFGDAYSGRNAGLPFIQNITLQGTNTSIGWLGVYRACIINGLKGNLPTPPSIDNYSLPDSSPVKELYYVEWRGFENYPTARGRYFRHGRVVSRVTSNPPEPNTFEFRLSETTNIKPIYLDWEINGGGTIQVSGTITQMGSGESVKVQIFSVGKEPLLGDAPDYEQTYTATGDISVNWTPTDARTWIIRILAYPQQTTNPIVIQNLQVAGGGTGGGGQQPAGEPAFVFVG